MSTVSTAVTAVTGIWPTVIKWVAIVGAVLLLCVLSFFWGDHIGSATQATAQSQADVKSQQATITQVQTQTVVDTTQVQTLQKQVDDLTAVNTALQLQIKQAKTLTVVTPATTTAAASCKLGADWVSSYNGSLN